MKKIFDEYGSAIIVVVVISLLLGIAAATTVFGGPLYHSFNNVVEQYNDGSTPDVDRESLVANRLATPSISIHGSTLTIAPVLDAEAYEVRADGTLLVTTAGSEVDLSAYLSAEGTYSMAVKAIATGLEGSVPSTASYVIGGADAGIHYVDFTITKENRSEIGYTDATTDLVIPETFYDEEDCVWYRVVAIDGNAFYTCANLESIEIPDSVTSIGGNAFGMCTSLTSIEIPAGVTSINNAFQSCTSLESVTFGENSQLTNISNATFYGCSSLTSIGTVGSGANVEIPDGVTNIGNSVFSNCTNLTSVEIPDGVTSIGANAFYGCTSLTSVTFKNATGWYVSTSSTATSGTNLTLSNASSNATYLLSTYRLYYWFRSE